MQVPPLLRVLIALAFTNVALAQNDECATAIDLGSGQVMVPIQTGGATTSPPSWPCAAGGSDVWYRWTPHVSGKWIFSTCNEADFDTVIEVFGGTCGALISLGCNDDGVGCNPGTSELTIDCAAGGLNAGTDYYIRVGGINGATGATNLRIRFEVEIVDTLPGSFIDISGTGTPLSIGDDLAVDIVTSISNPLFAGGTIRVASNGGVRMTGTNCCLNPGNLPIPSSQAFFGRQALLPFWDDINTDSGNQGEIYWEEVAGTLVIQWDNVLFFPADPVATFQVQVPSSGPVLAQFIYTDIMAARPDGGGSATIGYQAFGFANDVQWSYNHSGAVSDGTVLSLVISSFGLGSAYCSPAVPNSGGLPARILACGSDVAINNDVTLIANQLPPSQFGYFLAGQTQGLFMPANSQGFVCLAGNIGRYQNDIGQGPTFSLQLDLTSIPVNPPTAVLPGDTWNFQAWYRDVGNTNNFTDAVSVTFQ